MFSEIKEKKSWMVYTIKDIRIDELRNFINSNEFKKLDNLPISYHRAVSYINNHRANNQDIAIALLYRNEQLIAYRCLYSDYFFLKDKKVDFAWISGSWVHPDYRRQGYSMKLLKHCIEKNNEQLMFSNYAPESKSLYDKSGQFSKVAELKGKRFYFRFSFAELLPPKYSFFKKIKPILSFTDFLLNILFDIRFLFYKNTAKSIHYKEKDSIGSETHHFIETHNKNNPFKRNSKEINHAMNYPWIIENAFPDEQDTKYYFSSSAKVFKYIKVKVCDEKNNLSAFLLLKIRNKSMTIPYTFFRNKELDKLIKIIIDSVKKYKIKYLTIYNSLLIDELLKEKKLILFSKNMHRKFFATNKMAEMFDKSAMFYDGDGDNLYT